MMMKAVLLLPSQSLCSGYLSGSKGYQDSIRGWELKALKSLLLPHSSANLQAPKCEVAHLSFSVFFSRKKPSLSALLWHGHFCPPVLDVQSPVSGSYPFKLH